MPSSRACPWSRLGFSLLDALFVPAALVGGFFATARADEVPPAAKPGLRSTGEKSAPDKSALKKAEAQPSPAQVKPVDPQTTVSFVQDVLPIFQRRCLECHGPAKQQGTLRLDDHASLQVGGDSKIPVLGTPLEKSELYRRLTTSEASERMPLGRPPLEEGELALIRRWIEQGAVWPQPAAEGQHSSSKVSRWSRLEARAHRLGESLRPLHGLLYAALAVAIGILLIERAKRLTRRQHRWTQGKWGPLFRGAERVGSMWYLVILLLFFIPGLWKIVKQQRIEIENLQQRLAESQENNRPELDADELPQPFRPSHPPQLGGVYYRGNDKREPVLFNGGNYRTAVFDLSLCDADKHPLELGNPVIAGPLWIRLEIERGANAVATLFSEHVMALAGLSRQYKGHPELLDVPAMFQTIEKGERWVAYYPLNDTRSPHASGQPREPLRGLIYLYGEIFQQDGMATPAGDPHYGILYELSFDGDKIGPGSELWMGAVFVTGNVTIPKKGRIPLTEWFGHQPIPEIVSQPDVSAKALGIEEHEQRGLLPLGTAKPAEKDIEPAPATKQRESQPR